MISTARRPYDFLWIKHLIWSYFFLLIFEGALRKWVLPSASNALLLVRDPVVLAAYFLAWRSGLFPRNAFVSVGMALGVVSLVAGLLVDGNTPAVALYGFRADFLQLPFIFLIYKIFDVRDVERVGYWTLLLSIGMAVLMIVQFGSAPGAWINVGANESFEQLPSALGHIRPAGTFSYVSGPSYFFPLVVVFLLANSFFGRYPTWLITAATLATLSATAVSGSRALVFAIGLVFLLGLGGCAVLRPTLALRWIAGAAVLAVAAFFLSQFGFFQQGVEVFSQRVTGAAAAESDTGGIVGRIITSYTEPLSLIYDAPLWGSGLGVGTIAGSVLLGGEKQFLGGESEFSRVLWESGPLLGGAFVVYRLTLAAWMGTVAVRHTARHDPLSLLLFGSCFFLIISANIGQPTSLGFMVLLSGLCLSALRAGRTRPSVPPNPQANVAVPGTRPKLAPPIFKESATKHRSYYR